MANLNNNPFIRDTGLNEENSLMHLFDAISRDEGDEVILLEHSKYFDDLSFKNILCKHNGKILSLNCQSINAEFDKLIFLLTISMIIFQFQSYVFRSFSVMKELI